MKTLTIRGMPDEVHKALKERARRNRRSLNQEVISELAGGGGGEIEMLDEDAQKNARAERMVKTAEKWRTRLSGSMAGEEIDAAIDEGRE